MALKLNATVNQYDVARSVVRDDDMLRDNYRGLLDFITDIDEFVCDLQFTVALRDRLNDIIKAEEE